MGVRGLTSYINSIGGLSTRIELRNTKLVIDGPSLYSALLVDNGLDRRCGGQYEEFYRIVLSFFDALNSRGVESFVILDGAHDSSDKKLETFKKRAVDRIQTADALSKNSIQSNGDVFLLPLLSNLVFVQALKERDIKFAVADNEADAEIASLANAWNCPVLSSDSDFFIFDIKGGFIPLSSFDWKSSLLSANIFHRRKLASHLGIRVELLPLFASLVGNDYVSWDALDPFIQAISRNQTSRGHFSRKEARFASIASLLSNVPGQSVLQIVSCYGGAQLREAVEHSLQEYTITESSLLRYFQGVAVYSSLRTHNNHEVDEWVLRRFRAGQLSVNCMSGLTSGTVLLRFQVENCREISANNCSLYLRRFVYGILNDATAHNRRGNITTVQEWDREGLTVKQANVAPYQVEGVVPGASLIPRLNKEERLTILLVALDSNTAYIRSLPEKFKLIAASLRFLAKNAQPSLETNHLVALLCSLVKLEDGSWKQYMESTKRSWSLSLSQPFDLRAAQSFAQWQCVLRDAVHLNFVLLEPVETPCIYKTFNGRLVHYLQKELDQGGSVEKLLPSSSNRFLYKELCNALTNDREGKNDEGLSRKYSAGIKKNTYQTRDSFGFSTQSHAPVGNRTAVTRLAKQRREEFCQPRQTQQLFSRQQEQHMPPSRYQTSLQYSDRPMREPPVPQDGASRWSFPLSPSERYREDHWEEQYPSALPLEATRQASVYTKRGQYTRRTEPEIPKFNRVVPGACTENIKEDEIAARLQNLNLRLGPNQSENFTTGESSWYSRSTLPPRSVSPPKEVSPSIYNPPSQPSSSRAAGAASYNSMVYTSKSQKPHNDTTRPRSAAMSFPSTRNRYPSRTWSMDKAEVSDSYSWSSDESWSDDFTGYSDSDFY